LSSKQITLIITGIMLASIVVLYEHQVTSTSTPIQVLQQTYMTVPANLVIGQNVSALNIPLTRLAVSSEGAGSLPYETLPKMILDHNMTLVIYNGTTANGTLVAEVATNVGSDDIYISGMDLNGGFLSYGGEYKVIMEKSIIGCTQDQSFKDKETTISANGTETNRYVDTLVKCMKQANHGPTILKPGESLTTYIVGDMKKGATPIDKFSGGVFYSVANSPPGFNIQVPIVTVQ